MQIGLPTVGFTKHPGVVGAGGARVAPAGAEAASSGAVPASEPEVVQRVNEASASASANSSSDGSELQARDVARGATSDPASLERTADEQRVVQQLQARDRQVRSHEQAHLAASGGLANGGPGFTFTTGPDGRRYAVGGEVRIDTSGVPGDPEATIRKAQQIRRAALAPADPSARDQQIAAQATVMEQQARAELAQLNAGQIREDSGEDSSQQASPTNSTDPSGRQSERSAEAARNQLRAAIGTTEAGIGAGTRFDTFV